MPLAFDSISHGSIAFGFFNIDSDMLLLEHYFFFATEFCRYVSEIPERGVGDFFKTSWQVYWIEDPRDIGDLMGAIHGIHFRGFIGELYRKFPFPKNPEDFKQKPEGVNTQAVVKNLIAKYAKQVEIPFVFEKGAREVGIGEYRFSKESFHELIKYFWRGGYPGWKGEVRPDYVLAMKRRIKEHQATLFDGISFEE